LILHQKLKPRRLNELDDYPLFYLQGFFII